MIPYFRKGDLVNICNYTLVYSEFNKVFWKMKFHNIDINRPQNTDHNIVFKVFDYSVEYCGRGNGYRILYGIRAVDNKRYELLIDEYGIVFSNQNKCKACMYYYDATGSGTYINCVINNRDNLDKNGEIINRDFNIAYRSKEIDREQKSCDYFIYKYQKPYKKYDPKKLFNFFD